MKLAASLLLLAAIATASAQTPQFTDPANLRGERVKPRDGRELPIDTGTLGLQQLLRKLSTRASILNIVAHPDDEDGGMLTLCARGLGARVADLSLTRGEGGQNAMTGDFEDALGLLRTQELLANDRYTGVDQMFGTEVDFGFSKTKEEAFTKWTHDRVLYDAVRAIRLYRPLVITATFIGGVTDGHGQHQVSGQIAQEAFLAAGDPSIFPDMIAEGILPWQPLKVYARVPTYAISDKGLFDYATNQYTPARFTNYVTGEVTTTPPSADIIVHEGTPDPLLTTAAANPVDLSSALTKQTTPLTYIQFSRIGLGLQKSQIGPGFRTASTGAFDVAYHLYGSCLPNSPTLHLCHFNANQAGLTPHASQANLTLDGDQASLATNPSANGAPHTSLGQSPRSINGEDARGLKARLITASFTPTPSASGAPYTSVGRSPTKPPTKAPQGPEARPIAPSADPNFFTGIDTSLESISTYAPEAFPPNFLATIANTIQRATAQFNPAHPEAIASTLATALKDLDQLITTVDAWHGNPTAKANALHELRIKRVQLNDALTLALGLTFDATAASANLVQNTPSEVHTSLIESSAEPINYGRADIYSPGHGQNAAFDPPSLSPRSNPVEFSSHLSAAEVAIITQPYFYRDNIEQPVYKLRDPSLRNAPATPSPLAASATVTYESTWITIGRIVHSGPQPVSIVPPVSIASAPTATLLPLVQTIADLTATLTTDTSTAANINVQSPHDWTVQAKALPATASGNSIRFILHPTGSFTGPQLFHVTAETPDHHTYTEGYRPIGYGDLPRTNFYTPATTRIVPVDLNLPTHHHIAYLPGTGDAVPAALASIGLTPTILTVADLTPTNLAQYDTVILGVRTYNAHPDLHGAPTQALLDYARNGGNVVVQYQTPEFTAADAPYPLSLGSNEKVVDETAPVELLAPTSPLLTTPNRITPADFNNWIEERGHGFLSSWDPHYTALTETHDPGAPSENVAPQLPQRGGLITTPLGKGRWTYVAFALYRQLPEAVPGAYRLFLNLLNP
jgi:LmbE family N-acetylglucosaminyl deacetylase